MREAISQAMSGRPHIMVVRSVECRPVLVRVGLELLQALTCRIPRYLSMFGSVPRPTLHRIRRALHCANADGERHSAPGVLELFGEDMGNDGTVIFYGICGQTMFRLCKSSVNFLLTSRRCREKCAVTRLPRVEYLGRWAACI